MHQLHGHRAFAHRRRHPLDALGPHISHRKDVRHARLKQIRMAPQRPPCLGQIIRLVRARLQELFVIERNAPL